MISHHSKRNNSFLEKLCWNSVHLSAKPAILTNNLPFNLANGLCSSKKVNQQCNSSFGIWMLLFSMLYSFQLCSSLKLFPNESFQSVIGITMAFLLENANTSLVPLGTWLGFQFLLVLSLFLLTAISAHSPPRNRKKQLLLTVMVSSSSFNDAWRTVNGFYNSARLVLNWNLLLAISLHMTRSALSVSLRFGQLWQLAKHSLYQAGLWSVRKRSASIDPFYSRQSEDPFSGNQFPTIRSLSDLTTHFPFSKTAFQIFFCLCESLSGIFHLNYNLKLVHFQLCTCWLSQRLSIHAVFWTTLECQLIVCLNWLFHFLLPIIPRTCLRKRSRRFVGGGSDRCRAHSAIRLPLQCPLRARDATYFRRLLRLVDGHNQPCTGFYKETQVAIRRRTPLQRGLGSSGFAFCCCCIQTWRAYLWSFHRRGSWSSMLQFHHWKWKPQGILLAKLSQFLP